MPRNRRWTFLLAGLLTMSSGCGSSEALGFGALTVLSDGVINDPSNKSLRFDILKFGLDQFCTEMSRRGAPLKLRDGEPVLGRFFASTCNSQIIDEEGRQSFIVQYTGRGYGYTNITRRLGFEAAGLVEYATDFQVHGDAMYIYFRPRNVGSASFDVRLVEGALANAGIALTGVNPSDLGKNILESQLKRGFTVVRYSKRGETDFSMGLIAVGQRPFRPFNVVSSDKPTLENDRTEVHQDQQDFIGGFSVPDSDQALQLTMTLDGAAAVDVLVVAKPSGDLVLNQFTTRAGPTPLNFSPAFSDVLQANTTFSRLIALPQGEYYLMIDHSSAVGVTTPPTVLLDDRAARVDYLVQLADAP